MLQDKPSTLPSHRPDGRAVKEFVTTILERRATEHFTDDDVPEEYLDAILACAAQAPSGYNLQPWRFVVVREPERRKRLEKAAMGQPKVGEAPVVVIALGMRNAWRDTLDEVFEEGVRRGIASPEKLGASKHGALQFLDRQPMDVWVTRHTMIAVTYLMLAAEAYGFDTAPMEGFDPTAVKREFAIPDDAEVVALLAIGRAKQPTKAYPGRLGLDRLVHYERFDDEPSGDASTPQERAVRSES